MLHTVCYAAYTKQCRHSLSIPRLCASDRISSYMEIRVIKFGVLSTTLLCIDRDLHPVTPLLRARCSTGELRCSRTHPNKIGATVLFGVRVNANPRGATSVSDVYWGSWIRTNEMTESKSVALPLGYTPRIGRDETRPGSLSYSGVLPPYHQSL